MTMLFPDGRWPSINAAAAHAAAPVASSKQDRLPHRLVIALVHRADGGATVAAARQV